MEKKKALDSMLQIRLPAAEYVELIKAAKRRKTTISKLLREILANIIKRGEL